MYTFCACIKIANKIFFKLLKIEYVTFKSIISRGHVDGAVRPRLSRLNNQCNACTSDGWCVTPPQGQVITQERELRQELKRNMLRPRGRRSTRELLRIVSL